MSRKIIDERGSFCPGPLMELIAAMKAAEVGDELEILSTEQGAANEIAEWINKVGHEYIGVTEEDAAWHVVVIKSK